MAYIKSDECVTYNVLKIWLTDFFQYEKGSITILGRFNTVEECVECIEKEIRLSTDDYQDFYKLVIEPVYTLCD